MEILTITETAKLLHCSVSNIRNMVRNNEIPFFRLGTRIYFNKETIANWLHTKEIQSLNSKIEQNQIKSMKGTVSSVE